MAIIDHGRSVALYLSPDLRGAPDSIVEALSGVLAVGGRGELVVASQQVSERRVVELLAGYAQRHGVRVLVEGMYLRERQPVGSSELWEAGGHFEPNRQAMSALLRSGVEVRPDVVSHELQHANFLVAGAGSSPSALLTSANLSPGSVSSHYNWAVRTERRDVAEGLQALFEAAWDGDFRDAAASTSHGGVRLEAGADGQALNLLTEIIETAQESLAAAFFNMSAGSPIVDLLVAAAQRGVMVTVFVDGDQSNQGWDAVPFLQDAGIDARYYPGALTGAAGRRMHYKMAAVDDRRCYLGTANVSASAERSLELALAIDDTPEMSGFIRAEIERLRPLSKARAIHMPIA